MVKPYRKVRPHTEKLPERKLIAIRMSAEARDALNLFSKTLGVSRAAILELTIREFAHTALARRHGLKFSRAAVNEMAARLLANSQN